MTLPLLVAAILALLHTSTGTSTLRSQILFPRPLSAAVALPPSPAAYAYSAAITSSLLLQWNRNGNSFDFQATYSGLHWISVGFSKSGFMADTPNSNAVICSPANSGSPMQEYEVLGYTLGTITPYTSGGVSNMACTQSGGKTIMTWTRLANNGVSGDAQISLTSNTYVIYCIGTSNTYNSGYSSMSSKAVNFAQGGTTPTPTTSPPAVSPSPSATPAASSSSSSSKAPASPSSSSSSSTPASASSTASPSPSPTSSSSLTGSDSGSPTSSLSTGASPSPTSYPSPSSSLSSSPSLSSSSFPSSTRSSSHTSSRSHVAASSSSFPSSSSSSSPMPPSGSTSAAGTATPSPTATDSSSAIVSPPLQSDQSVLIAQGLTFAWAGDAPGLTSFLVTYNSPNWFGVSVSGSAEVIGVDPSTGTASLYTATAGVLVPALVTDPSITMLTTNTVAGQTTVSWSQTVTTPVSSAIVQYWLGASPSLSASSVAASGSASLAPSAPAVSCHDVPLSSSLSASWTVINNNLLSMQITLKGSQAWVSAGWSKESYSAMIGGDVVIGRWDISPAFAVMEYIMTTKDMTGITRFPTQELSASSLSFTAGNTVMNFTRPLFPNDNTKLAIATGSMTVIWAYGGSTDWEIHIATGANKVNFHTCAATSLGVDAWKLAHGFLMALGWGAMLPAGICVSLFFRKTLPRTGPHAYWFVWHLRLQVLGLLAALVGLVIAVSMTKGHHLQDTHSKLGLALMCVGVAQAAGGALGRLATDKLRLLLASVHKFVGFGSVIIAAPTISLGLRALGTAGAHSLSVVYIVAFALACGTVVLGVAYVRSQDGTVSPGQGQPLTKASGRKPEHTVSESRGSESTISPAKTVTALPAVRGRLPSTTPRLPAVATLHKPLEKTGSFRQTNSRTSNNMGGLEDVSEKEDKRSLATEHCVM